MGSGVEKSTNYYCPPALPSRPPPRDAGSMMRTYTLYPFLLLSVLLLAACSEEKQTDNAAAMPDTAQASPPRATAPADTAARRTSDEPVVLVLGNSLAAGYGLNPEQAFPALLQEKIDSLGWDFQVVNAGLSG